MAKGIWIQAVVAAAAAERGRWGAERGGADGRAEGGADGRAEGERRGGRRGFGGGGSASSHIQSWLFDSIILKKRKFSYDSKSVWFKLNTMRSLPMDIRPFKSPEIYLQLSLLC